MGTSSRPLEYRSTYVASLKKLLKFPVGVWSAHKFRLNLDSLINKYEFGDYDTSLHDNLRAEIQEQDSHRTTQLQDVDRFLYSWIHNK